MAVMKNILREMHHYMKENGFSLRNRCFFHIENNLAYCVELEMPSGLIYVNCYIIPLYIPTEFRYYTYGIRLRDVLSISNIGTAEINRWCNQLKVDLQRSVFPVFEKAKTPHSFVNLVNKGLFKDNCHISKVDIYRLRVFTASYYNDAISVSQLCEEYEKILSVTTYLTDGAKKKLVKEIQELRDNLSGSPQENEAYTMGIIKKVKQGCFGWKKTGDGLREP